MKSSKTSGKLGGFCNVFFKPSTDKEPELKRTSKGGKIVLPEDYIHQENHQDFKKK